MLFYFHFLFERKISPVFGMTHFSTTSRFFIFSSWSYSLNVQTNKSLTIHPEVKLMDLMMMSSSTTHLSIELLDGISLVLSSLVGTNLHREKQKNTPYSVLSELVHLLFSVVTTSLFNKTTTKVSYSENIHHVLFVREKTSNFTNKFADLLHSLGTLLRNYKPLIQKLLS